MTPEQASEEIKRRIGPVLEELGIDSWILMGYATDGEGRRGRAAIGHINSDPVMRDAMRPIVAFAHAWSQPDPSEQPNGR